MADVVPKDQITAALAVQLQQSRQQQSRLRDALTRVLSLIERDQTPEPGQ